MLLHGDSKHDDVQAFFLLPLLTFILSYLPNITCIRAHPGTGDSVAPSPRPRGHAAKGVWSLPSFLVWTPFPLGWTLISGYFSQRVCDRLQVSSARTGRLSSLAVRLQLPKSKLGDMNMQINASKLIAALLPPRGSKLG